MARLALCFALLAHLLAGEKRALLIGISQYHAIRGLQGPEHDVAALAKVLRQDYAFDHIKILLNAEATRQAILTSIAELTRDVKHDDYVFIYFSGHGTSAADEKAQRFGLNLDLDTGALVPYDVATTSASKLTSTLIIGKRDLRPLLKTLDTTGAETWIVFDSCFSEKTVRSVSFSGGNSRYLPLIGWDIASSVRPDRDLGFEESYPYRNIIYNSAAAYAETALDISTESMRNQPGYRTIDGQPHGAFTNALLEGISGIADSNHDGIISYEELHAYLLQRVKPTFGHTPKLFPSDPATTILRHPIFGARNTAQTISQSEAHRLRLLISADINANLDDRITSITQLDAIRENKTKPVEYDLRLTRVENAVQLVYKNGTILGEFPLFNINALMQQLRREAALQSLISFKIPNAEFNTWISNDPPNRGVLFDGDTVSMLIKSERSVFPLVLSVDTKANLFVLYPTKDKHSAIPGGAVVRLPEVGRIQSPFGLERIFMCAFVEESSDYTHWAGTSMSPLDQNFPAFVKFLGEGCRAHMMLTLTTAPR